VGEGIATSCRGAGYGLTAPCSLGSARHLAVDWTAAI
jgi:hypothetical protein